MRLLKFELKKLIQTPMFWVFAALSIGFNSFIIIGDSYWAGELNQFSREVYESGEYTDSEIGDVYADYSGEAFAERIVAHLGLEGLNARLMRAKYEKMQAVADDFSEQGISYYFYADGLTQTIHTQLFSKVMRLILVQTALFAALAMLCSLGYEKQSKTESVVYPSRTGRKVMRHKYVAGLLFGAVGFILIAGLTFAVYFSVWDYSGLWQSNVSSAFNYIPDIVTWKRPFITWQSFSVAEYFTAFVGLGFALTLVFAALAGVIGLTFRNTYTSFAVFGLLSLFMMFACMLFGSLGLMTLHYVFTFSPVVVWYMAGQWFTDMGATSIIAWQETWAVAFNFVVLAGFSALAMKLFRKRDML
jgi:hypothetical protein